MKKFFSLLKAVMSQDMNLFVYKAKKNSSQLKKGVVPALLALLVMYAIGSMYFSLAYELNKNGLVRLILPIAIAIPSLLALMEGIYKSQGILFEAKDNELLSSLPISKKQILLAKITKLFVFQFLYSMLFVIPGILIYMFFARPGAYFYAITALMLILLPIIPTALGCIIGFFIQKFSVRFKKRKIIQTITTFAMILLIMSFSFRMQDIINSLIENADTINNTLTKVYYPIGAYINLINSFNLLEITKLLIINIVFVVVFVFVVSKSFFNVLSKTKENLSFKSNELLDESSLNFKPKSILKALLKKEFRRYFSSTVYMFNTMFGLVILVIATISLCTNFDSAITSLASDDITSEDIQLLFMLAPKIYISAVIAMSFMTSITSSSISLEGKTFNISKSLPVKIEKILSAKILMSDIITIPVILICDVIFFLSFDMTIMDIITILISSFVAPTISAIFGLIINLKYPKMNASSDSEVVKQSMSSMVSVFGGMLCAGIFGVMAFVLAGLGDFAILFEAISLIIVLIILWIILIKYGQKRYKEIEV